MGKTTVEPIEGIVEKVAKEHGADRLATLAKGGLGHDVVGPPVKEAPQLHRKRLAG